MIKMSVLCELNTHKNDFRCDLGTEVNLPNQASVWVTDHNTDTMHVKTAYSQQLLVDFTVFAGWQMHAPESNALQKSSSILF